MQHLFGPQAGCGTRVSLFRITRQGPWRGRRVGGKEAKTESASRPTHCEHLHQSEVRGTVGLVEGA